jgi:hypothetical protein
MSMYLIFVDLRVHNSGLQFTETKKGNVTLRSSCQKDTGFKDVLEMVSSKVYYHTLASRNYVHQH